ncbi:MAG: hypothetical protein AAGK93_00995, partial [Pseudomonadota bacterium]
LLTMADTQLSIQDIEYVADMLRAIAWVKALVPIIFGYVNHWSLNFEPNATMSCCDSQNLFCGLQQSRLDFRLNERG